MELDMMDIVEILHIFTEKQQKQFSIQGLSLISNSVEWSPYCISDSVHFFMFSHPKGNICSGTT